MVFRFNLVLALASTSLLFAQADHRLHVPDLTVVGGGQNWHVGFVADGVAGVQMVLREYQPATDTDIAQDNVVLPGEYVGHGAQIPGSLTFLVGTVSPTNSLATRVTGHLSLVRVDVNAGTPVGLSVLATTALLGIDPHTVYYDSGAKHLYIVDHAWRCIRRAAYVGGQSLPGLASWGVLADSGMWGNDEALLSSWPIRANDTAGSVDWFSALDPTVVRTLSGSPGAGVVLVVGEEEAPVSMGTLPFANAVKSWSFTALRTGVFSVIDPRDQSTIYSGNATTGSVYQVPPLAALNDLVGQNCVLAVGSSQVHLGVRAEYGRPVSLASCEVGSLQPGGDFLVGGRLLPVTLLDLSASSAQAWVLVAFRDHLNGTDPIQWQSDMAVIDTSTRGGIVPFALSQSNVWGAVSKSVAIPSDSRLADVIVFTQVVVRVGQDYAVTQIASHRIVTTTPPASAQDREAAIGQWVTALSGATPALNTALVLSNLQGR